MKEVAHEQGHCGASQPRFEVSLWGIQISGYGATGIAAAVVVVGLIVAGYRF